MTPLASAAAPLLAIIVPWLGDVPNQSAAVVEAHFTRFGLADGLESCFLSLTIKPGWHVYANPISGKETATEDAKNGVAIDPKRGVTFEVKIDGKRASVIDYWFHRGVVKRDAAGKKYRAYEGRTSATVWLVWEETQDAKVLEARVRVIATDGKRRLKPSVLRAAAR